VANATFRLGRPWGLAGGKTVDPLHRRKTRNVAYAVGFQIGDGVDAQDALDGGGVFRIDPHDLCMGMGRPHEYRMSLPIQIDVVHIAAFAAQKTQVLDPRDALSHTELTHCSLRSPLLLLPDRVVCGGRHYRQAVRMHESLNQFTGDGLADQWDMKTGS